MNTQLFRAIPAPLRVVFAFALLPLVLQACGKSNAGVADKAPSATQVVNVRVETVTPTSFTETIQVTGSVEAYDDVMVPSEEGGRVKEWLVQKGASVRAGQVIARIDDAILRSAWEAAHAAYQIAEVNYTKQKKVYEEQAVSELQLKTLEYQRDAAKAQADLARVRLEKCSIKSPINGVLETRTVDAGEMIGPGAPIARIVGTGRLKITAGVPERYAGLFKVGDRVIFRVDALAGEEFTARVSVVGAAVNRDNRSIPMEATVTATARALKPEMIAAMSIRLAERPNSIVIDDDFMQQTDRNQWVVYVANGDVAEERSITIGATNSGKVLVTKGLAAGDRLITLGHQNVANGQKIVIAN